MSTLSPSPSPSPAPAEAAQDQYSHADLLRCGEGGVFGDAGPRLPSPPFLMFDRISRISKTGGAYDKGEMRAELSIKEDLWFFACHFKGDPVMPGCLGLDALWQMLGFFLGWLGKPGRGRALGVGKVRFNGMIFPDTKLVEYRLAIKRVVSGRLIMGIADGAVLADGEQIYTAEDLRCGLFSPEVLMRK